MNQRKINSSSKWRGEEKILGKREGDEIPGDRAERCPVKGKISPVSYTAGPHGNGEGFLFLLNWALRQVKENIFPTPNGKMQGRRLK